MLTLVGGDLYQWDTGRRVLVEAGDGVVSHEVHFSNDSMTYAHVVSTYSEGINTYCNIPDVILRTNDNLYCYEVCKNANGEETSSMVKLKVKARNRPYDYLYTELDKITFESLSKDIKELNNKYISKDAISKIVDEKLGVIENASY